MNVEVMTETKEVEVTVFDIHYLGVVATGYEDQVMAYKRMCRSRDPEGDEQRVNDLRNLAEDIDEAMPALGALESLTIKLELDHDEIGLLNEARNAARELAISGVPAQRTA